MNKKYLEKLTNKIKDTPADYEPSLCGLGGWMTVVIIFRLLTVTLALLYIPDYIASLGNSIDEYYFGIINLVAYIPFEVGIHIAILIYIFKRNIMFRKLFVIYVVVAFLLNFGGALYLYIARDILSLQILFGLFSNALWILYMYKSKRVKNTFIYPYADFKKKEMIKFKD